MHIQIRAILQTALLLGSACAMALGVNWINNNVDTETLKIIVPWMFISVLIYLVYRVVLARLQYYDSVSKMTSKYNEK